MTGGGIAGGLNHAIKQRVRVGWLSESDVIPLQTPTRPGWMGPGDPPGYKRVAAVGLGPLFVSWSGLARPPTTFPVETKIWMAGPRPMGRQDKGQTKGRISPVTAGAGLPSTPDCALTRGQ